MTRWQDIAWPPDEGQNPTARQRLAREIRESCWIAQADAESRKELRRRRRQRTLYPVLVVLLVLAVLLWLILVPVPL